MPVTKVVYMPSSNAPLFAPQSCLGDTAVLDQNHDWTWGEIHSAAIILADRFEWGHSICNLCSSYLAFMITWFAALRCGLPLILPPSRGALDLKNVLESRTGSTIVVHDAQENFIKMGSSSKIKYIHFKPEVPCVFRMEDLAWAPELDRQQIELYTSGSTGKPELHYRSLAHLIEGARVLGARLSQRVPSELQDEESPLLDHIDYLISSVPSQHMFGLETALMLSLVHNKVVINKHPLLPGDIQEICEEHPGNIAWITIPLHLRALIQTNTKLSNCVLVMNSTMPLSEEAATKTEQLIRGTVVEIYGSTETGALATRFSTQTRKWCLLDSVRFNHGVDGFVVYGPHFESPQVVHDAIEMTDARTFNLLGRRTDLIKVAGRRHSLAALNIVLLDIEGLIDGSFFMTTQRDDIERPVLICSLAQEMTVTRIRKELKKRIDPVFVPRTIIQVPKIPRDERGKISTTELRNLYVGWYARKAR